MLLRGSRQALPARPKASQELGAKRQQEGDVVTRLAEVDLQARREKLQRTMDHSRPGSVVPKAARGAVVVREVS